MLRTSARVEPATYMSIQIAHSTLPFDCDTVFHEWSKMYYKFEVEIYFIKLSFLKKKKKNK